MVGIDIVFIAGVFVSTGVGCLVVSTNAPQLASLDVVVVWVNGWSKWDDNWIRRRKEIESKSPEKKFFVGDVFVCVVVGTEDCKISSKSAKSMFHNILFFFRSYIN